jgi:hypothetical protein
MPVMGIPVWGPIILTPIPPPTIIILIMHIRRGITFIPITAPAREADFMAQPEDIIDRREYPDRPMKDCREALDLITGGHPGIL